MKCDYCGKETEDVEETIDPYDSEINDDYSIVQICEQCYEERCEEV